MPELTSSGSTRLSEIPARCSLLSSIVGEISDDSQKERAVASVLRPEFAYIAWWKDAPLIICDTALVFGVCV